MTNLQPRLAWLLLFGLASLAAAADGSSDQQFLAGLRQRGLFRLAETYCAKQLDKPELSESQRAELVIELSRCLAERATGSPPEARGPLWQRALQVADDFARQYPESPRLPLVRLQAALGNLARGELARQEAEVAAGRGNLLDEARTYLRTAVGELRRLADDVQRRLQLWNLSDRGEPAALTAHQLASLEKNIQYQLARAFRNQAQCYANDSPDRANSLNRAVELLAPLAKLDPVDPLAWKSRIDLIVCHRLLAREATARQLLDALPGLNPPPAIQLRARAERIHLALDTDQLSEAISVLSQGRRIDGVTSAELDYAWLETYLRAAGDAKDSTMAAPWQAKATDMVERIEERYGPYWTRRAGMLLSRYVRAAPAGGDLAMLVRAAESSYRSGRLDDALAAYDSARALAEKQDHADRAFEMGYIAATIEHKRDRHDQALARYRRIATAMPDHLKAAEAHLLAIYHAAQLAKEQPDASLDDYEALVQEHLHTWRDGPSTEKVRMRLGRLREHRGRWRKAIDAYRAVSAGSAEHQQAVEAAARCYRRWLDARKAAGRPTGEIAAEAAGWFESQMLGTDGRLPQRLGPVERMAALAAVRMRMDCTPADFTRAENILAAALQSAADAPPEWTAAAEVLLVFSLAGQGRRREARELLARISAGPPDQLLGMLQGLGRVAKTATAEVRTELAELQVQAMKLLGPHRARLSEAQRRILDRVDAQARLAIEEADAESLLARNDRGSLQEALEKWRRLEKKSRPGSPAWFRAKYAIAFSHYGLGNKQQAAKIIKLLQLLHPESGGPEMKPRFDELLRRCQG